MARSPALSRLEGTTHQAALLGWIAVDSVAPPSASG